MARPLMQHGIGQLEAMFASMSGDTKVLKQLENELSYRQVPRAYALAEKVAMALRTGEPAKPANPLAAASPPKQTEGDLFNEVAEPPVPVVLRSKVPPVLEPPASPAQPRPVSSTEPQFAVSADEAYRLLNVTPATAWEQVELSRQRLVNQAHPALLAKMSPERQTQATLDARRINAAYAVLAARRLGARLEA